MTLQRIGANLISTLTQIQETCQQSQDPLNFEQLDHGYGYVLYTTTLTAGGKNLATPNIRDYGYVFVNNVYQVKYLTTYKKRKEQGERGDPLPRRHMPV